MVIYLTNKKKKEIWLKRNKVIYRCNTQNKINIKIRAAVLLFNLNSIVCMPDQDQERSLSTPIDSENEIEACCCSYATIFFNNLAMFASSICTVQ